MNEAGNRQETLRNVPGSRAVEGPGRLAPPACLRLRTIGLALAVVVLVMTTAPVVYAAALHRAVKAGDLNGLTRALDAGADVNARDNRSRTALMYAVDKGYLLLVEPLLAAEANPNMRGPDGATALYIAAAHGHSELITMLMHAGADPTIKGPKGETATKVAQMRYGDPEAAQKKGADNALIALLNGQTWEEFENAAFARARSEGTRAAYAAYVAAFPDGRHVDEARDEGAFAHVRTRGTPKAYAAYVAAFPDGRHADEAREAAYAHARSEGTPKAYAAYVAAFPDERYAEEAREAAYAHARSEGTPAAYAAYVAAFPEGRHVEEAREAAYAHARSEGTRAAYAAYVSAFPEGRYADAARDEGAYAHVRTRGTLKAYAAYVSAFPEGRHAEEAREAAYAHARSEGTPTAYAAYVSAFPDGRRADAARDEIAFANADSLWTVEAYTDYIASYPSGRYADKARRWKAALERESPLTATSSAGTTVRECAACPEMVVVPAGDYMMGSPDGEGGREKNEGPVHRVTIAAPLAVGKYEVTFAEWDACVEAGGCAHRPGDEGWGRGTRPVINVSWEDAQAYVAWVSRETGRPYRLLSEGEWEYVARAETTGTYWWDGWFSTGADHAYANYGTDTCCEGKAAGADRWMHTSPVGSFEANAFGLVDTAGNVGEWVADCWHDSYRGAPSDGSARTNGDCGSRVLRGGSWYDSPRNLRSADRGGDGTGNRSSRVGFRLARTLD